MHDPMTQIYSNKFFILWHVDPCRDGTDDSCGRFIRSRHCDPKILKKIISEYHYQRNLLFNEKGEPILSTIGTVINLFHIAVWEHFKHDQNKTSKFMSKNLYEIILFAENPLDSIFPSINAVKLHTRSIDPDNGRMTELAHIIYPWIMRSIRPWYKNPKWHLHHWKIQMKIV